jgi:ribosomal protein L12E/L44/L45/RPP1/RPP2
MEKAGKPARGFPAFSCLEAVNLAAIPALLELAGSPWSKKPNLLTATERGKTMNKFIAMLIAAAFAASTGFAVAADAPKKEEAKKEAKKEMKKEVKKEKHEEKKDAKK